jgi:peptidoglycan/LPS O-acetylase OafA/YrhL
MTINRVESAAVKTLPRIAFLSRIFAIIRTGAHELVTPPAGNVPGLDVLRSLAIVLVVSGHFYGEFADRGQALRIGKFPLLYFAWTGVDLFFVLSGYLIGRQLWRELAHRHSIDVGRFLLRRGLRIWPFYFAFLAWVAVTSHKALVAYLPDLFFLSNYLPNQVSGGWSLSTEEQFYIFVPVLLLTAGLFVPVRRQYVVIVALLLMLPLVRYLTLVAHPGAFTPDMFRKLIQLPFHTHSDGLLAGLLISWVSVLKPGFLRPLPFWRNIILPSTMAVVGLALRSVNSRLFGFSALALIFGGLTVYVLRDRSAFTTLANRSGFYVLSRLSYGMYLNHFAVIAFAAPMIVAVTAHIGGYWSFFLGYPVAILAPMLVAAVTFITIESPFLQLRDRWLASAKRHGTLVQTKPHAAR